MICKLALEDGTVFTGTAVGASGMHTGEVVFNTAMTGYQEVFTDPSYCGQIVVMTFPHMGNYGVNPEDSESARPHLSGVVVKELPARPSNHRATASMSDFLTQQGIVGLSGIDTRALVRRIRSGGAMRGVISTEITDDVELVRRAAESPSMSGANLVERVAPNDIREWRSGQTPSSGGAARKQCHIVALDCGIKHNMLRHLVDCGCRVTVAPAGVSASQIRELNPSGLLVGNGPGDPAAVPETVNVLRGLLGEIPIFGICLGHQMLALALGAETYKLRFGHHGANVPVLNKPGGRVEITSQNHGFAVDVASLEKAGGSVTHVNLNDGSLEGFIHEDKQVLAVQFHPEAAPGPNDASYLFDRFVDAVRSARSIDRRILVH